MPRHTTKSYFAILSFFLALLAFRASFTEAAAHRELVSPVELKPSFFVRNDRRKASALTHPSHLLVASPRGGEAGATNTGLYSLPIWSQKKHTVLGTTCLKPIFYPTVDGLVQLAFFPLAHLGLTGKAKEFQLFFLWKIHAPLFFITNYGAKFFLPNWPIVPLWVMYVVDVFYVAFNAISPFVIDGYGAFKYLYAVGFGLAGLLFGVFDPFPSSKGE